MKREIKFRGKCVVTGRMLHGHYLMREDSLGEVHLISIKMSDDFVYEEREVDPSTVGQYTGLKDKHGKQIYEGDIVLNSIWTQFGPDIFEPYEVKFELSRFLLRQSHLENYPEISDNLVGSEWNELEIIGTIHDKELKD